MSSLFKKSETPEEFKMKFIFGICIFLVGISLFVFNKFLNKITEYSLVTDVLLILLIVFLPVGLFLLYFYLFEKRRIKNG